MKILVDTSVWSLLLVRKKESLHPAAQLLKGKIAEAASICIAGIIFQEILQGIRSDLHYQKVKRTLLDFDFLEETSKVHEQAAKIYRHCRKKGIQTTTIDTLLAALSIENESPLLTTDKDFEKMAKFISLQLIPWG